MLSRGVPFHPHAPQEALTMGSRCAVAADPRRHTHAHCSMRGEKGTGSQTRGTLHHKHLECGETEPARHGVREALHGSGTQQYHCCHAHSAERINGGTGSLRAY